MGESTHIISPGCRAQYLKGTSHIVDIAAKLAPRCGDTLFTCHVYKAECFSVGAIALMLHTHQICEYILHFLVSYSYFILQSYAL